MVTSNGVNKTVLYSGGNSGSYSAQNINSTGVTGLVASLAAGNFASGSGTLTFTIAGTPSAIGNASFALSIGGQNCSFTANVETNNAIGNGGFASTTDLAPWVYSFTGNAYGEILYGALKIEVAEYNNNHSVSFVTIDQAVNGVKTTGSTLSFRVATWKMAAFSQLEVRYNGVLYDFMASTRSVSTTAVTGQVTPQNGATGSSVNVTSTAINTTPTFYNVTVTLPAVSSSGTITVSWKSSTNTNNITTSETGFIDDFFLSRGY